MAAARNSVDDLRGGLRLVTDAVCGITGIASDMHRRIARVPTAAAGPLIGGAVNGTAAAVYGSVQGITRLVGGGLELALGAAAPALREQATSAELDGLVSVLNGVLGDHLARSDNPLALDMRLRHGGEDLPDSAGDIASRVPGCGSRLAVLVHGLCMNDASWTRDGQDHGQALARDLGYCPLYLRYNSGRHISSNGRLLAAVLESLLDNWPLPVDELALVGHSMGGLVIRSACHYAALEQHAWPRRRCRLVFLGSPHLGAPLERGGSRLDHWIRLSPYTAPLARLGRIRSAGITDLRHGYLRDEQWQGHCRFEAAAADCDPLPLPAGMRCHAVAASLREDRAGIMGDGLVPVHSALGRHADRRQSLRFPEAQRAVVYGAGHFDLLSRRDVYERIRAWLA